MSSTEEIARRWMAQWRVAGVRLAEVRRAELRSLTDADARAAIADLLALADLLPPREGGSGLVDQQRLLHSPRRGVREAAAVGVPNE